MANESVEMNVKTVHSRPCRNKQLLTVEISKLGHYMKRIRRSLDRFTGMVYARKGSVAEESRTLADVHDSSVRTP